MLAPAMHLAYVPLRTTRALQELNMAYIAPSTSSEICILTRIAFGFYS